MGITHLETAAPIDLADWTAAHVVAFVGCKVYATSTQAVSASTITPITFDSEEFDTDGFHSTGANTSRITIPSGLAGKYLFVVSGVIPNTGSTEIDFYKNGTTFVRSGGGGTHPGNRAHATCLANLSVADYIEAIVYTTVGGGLTIGHASAEQDQMTMAVQYLGA